MKLRLSTILIITGLLGCSKSRESTFYILINESFLSMVDTAAYKTGKLIQIPNEIQQNIQFNPCIMVDPIINESSEIIESISIATDDNTINDFKGLIAKNSSDNLSKIDRTKITNTGKYTLTSDTSECRNNTCIVGTIIFHKSYLSLDKAIITFTISQSEKSGITSSWFYRKQGEKWKVIKKVEIERW